MANKKPVTEKISYYPVYRYPFYYAKRNDEIDKYKSSRRLNIECKEAIEETIKQNFDGRHLNSDIISLLIKQYGRERITFVLANTLQQKEWDGRFSRYNIKWASTFYIPDDIVFTTNRKIDFIINTHPAVLNGFIDMFRKEISE